MTDSAREQGQIMVLTALVLVVVMFLMGLVIGVAQLYAAQAQLEKAVVLGGRSGAALLGSRITQANANVNDWASFAETARTEAASQVMTLAQTNEGAAEVTFNNAAEMEVTASKDIRLFFGFASEQQVKATATLQVVPQEDFTGTGEAQLFYVRVVPNATDPLRPAFDATYNQGYEAFASDFPQLNEAWLVEATAKHNPPEWGAKNWSQLRRTQPRIFVGLTLNSLMDLLTDRTAAQFAGGGVLTWPEDDLYIEDHPEELRKLLADRNLIPSDAASRPLNDCVNAVVTALDTSPFWVEGFAPPGSVPSVEMRRPLEEFIPNLNPDGVMGYGSGPAAVDPDGYWELRRELAFQGNRISTGTNEDGFVSVGYSPCRVPSDLTRLFVDPAGNLIVGTKVQGPRLISSGFLETFASTLQLPQLSGSALSARLVLGRSVPLGERMVRYSLNHPSPWSFGELRPVTKPTSSRRFLQKADTVVKLLSGGRPVAPIMDRHWSLLERKLVNIRPAAAPWLLARMRAHHGFLSGIESEYAPPGGTGSLLWAYDCVVQLGPFGNPDCGTEDYRTLLTYRQRSFSGDVRAAVKTDIERLIRHATGVAETQGYWPARLFLVYDDLPPSVISYTSGTGLQEIVQEIITENRTPCMQHRLYEQVNAQPVGTVPCHISYTPENIPERLSGTSIDTAVGFMAPKVEARTRASIRGAPLGAAAP